MALSAVDTIGQLSKALLEETSVSKIFKTIDTDLIEKFASKDTLVQQLMQLIDPLLIKLEPGSDFESQEQALYSFEAHANLVEIQPVYVKLAFITLVKLGKLNCKFHAVAYAFLYRQPIALDRALLTALTKTALPNCESVILSYFSAAQKTPNELYLTLLQQILADFSSQERYLEAYEFLKKQRPTLQVLLRQLDPSPDAVYQIALLYGVCGQVEQALEFLRSVESDDVKFDRLHVLLSALDFTDAPVYTAKTPFDDFFVLLQQYMKTSELAFLPDARKVTFEEMERAAAEHEAQLRAESYLPLVRQLLTQTHKFGLKMRLARRVYSAVPINFFPVEFHNDIDAVDGVVELRENCEVYATDRPRRILKGITKRIDAQRVVCLKNMKNEAVDEIEEISEDQEDDFFVLEFDEYE